MATPRDSGRQRTGTSSDQSAEAYEPPVVEELDTTYDPAATAAGATGGSLLSDTAFGSSDRRLKHGLAEVDRRAVLRAVASLRITG
jgi:hypothetical protein